MKQIAMPTIKPDLRKLILEALRLHYTSQSPNDKIETGNHYQSLTLGDEKTEGFRSDREAFLDRIDFKGKHILDLGSNLGEISRAARKRGARLVDGFEYDPFFVEIARAVNAYNGTTRVSFYERDITEASIYTEPYDIVLALSVFVYVQNVLPALATITDGVLVLETHRLENNFEQTYIVPIGQYFPHHLILGATEWGSGPSHSGERAIVVFAKTAEALVKHVVGAHTERRAFGAGRRSGTTPDIRYIDPRKTAWFDPFFERFRVRSAEQLLAEIGQMDVNVDELAHNSDLAANDLGGWVYWLIYLVGGLRWMSDGDAGPSNPYYKILGRHWSRDIGRAQDMSDPERLKALVLRRFEDFKLFRTNPKAPELVQPVQLVLTAGRPVTSATRSIKRVFETGRETPVETSTIDGYHRLFLARLFGHDHIQCDFVAERDAVLDENA